MSGADTFETGIFLHRKTDVVFDGLTLDDLDFNNLNVTMEKYDACKPYSNEILKDADIYWKGSMGFMCVSWLAGLILTLALFASSCCGGNSSYYRTLGINILLFPLLFQGLIFLSMQSDLCEENPFLTELLQDQEAGNSCEIGPSSGLIAGSMIGYFLAAVTTCCLGRTRTEDANNVDRKGISSPEEEDGQAVEPTSSEAADPSARAAVGEGVEFEDRGQKELTEVSVY